MGSEEPKGRCCRCDETMLYSSVASRRTQFYHVSQVGKTALFRKRILFVRICNSLRHQSSLTAPSDCSQVQPETDWIHPVQSQVAAPPSPPEAVPHPPDFDFRKPQTPSPTQSGEEERQLISERDSTRRRRDDDPNESDRSTPPVAADVLGGYTSARRNRPASTNSFGGVESSLGFETDV